MLTSPCACLSWCRQDAAATRARMITLVNEVRCLLCEVARGIASESIHLRTLHSIIHQQDSFLRLVRVMGVEPAVDAGLLGSRADGLRRFDSTLEQVQCFASLFCNCAGVRIETGEVRSQVDGIRGEYSGLRYSDTANVFGRLEVLPFVDWLYQLRSSELFLLLWRCAT